MKARKIKRRISSLMWARLHGDSSSLPDELLEWDREPAVGREFGSPDFERLWQEDQRRWEAEQAALSQTTTGAG